MVLWLSALYYTHLARWVSSGLGATVTQAASDAPEAPPRSHSTDPHRSEPAPLGWCGNQMGCGAQVRVPDKGRWMWLGCNPSVPKVRNACMLERASEPERENRMGIVITHNVRRRGVREVGLFTATWIPNRDAQMRRISLPGLQRRSASHERRELSNHRHLSGRKGQARQQSTLTSILSESRSGLHDPFPRTKDILADLNRSTSRVHLPLTTVSAQTQFGRVVSRMLNAAMATEPTGPTTRSYLTPTGLRKIEPYWYPYTTMAKGRWLGREMLEVVSTEFRDRSIDYYVRPPNF